jgi:hypothetical protein
VEESAMKSGVVFLLLFIVLASVAIADRGSIPYQPGVKIFEPNQKALIAWDGEEEILILSTDLRASSPTRVLEVLPLPARPEVKKGSVDSFRKAVQLINTSEASSMTRSKGGIITRSPAGQVVERKRIGAHNIAVVQVLDPKRFTHWVQESLQKDGAQQKTIPAVLSRSVQEYIDDGFTWFVFDTVDLGSETVSQDAIIYRFSTDKLYYPLRISRTDEGETDITLIILTPKMLSEFPGLPIKEIGLEHEPVTIGQSDLKMIDEDIAALLRGSPELKLRIWKLRGRLDSFHQDLLAH